ncbi:SMP-30/gluconolactonase/LRE family protein [Rhizobium puerariae]|uniref:SMP-30/gluconolactonase/LRE family protein n=1 Tax=Rhizobium puerariae TaxID=1585791 RepID=A0ABV6ARM2_9HYPH
MFFSNFPTVINSEVFTTVPDKFRKTGVRSSWSDANKQGIAVDCFIEGPAFDAEGNLYVVDIPHGRIFRIAPDRNWSLLVEYDGQPNGLKFQQDGRILVTDYRKGLLELDPETGAMSPVLAHRNSEGFKGLNDLAVASNGDIYFTDQGQTGLHDPSGRVFRLCRDGRLDCLMSNLPSPNGLVLSPDERVLFVAMTRDNSVWRAPLLRDGSVSKVGRFCSLFGTSGPDGLAMNEEGQLIVAHASLGQVFVFAENGECISRVESCTGKTCTNVAFGGDHNRQLFITESASGSILRADMQVAGIRLPRS